MKKLNQSSNKPPHAPKRHRTPNRVETVGTSSRKLTGRQDQLHCAIIKTEIDNKRSLTDTEDNGDDYFREDRQSERIKCFDTQYYTQHSKYGNSSLSESSVERK